MSTDTLLTALADARQRKDQADREIRLLIAYAREVVTPRPYRLADLARAAGMSISGVRTAYTHSDTQRARRLATEQHAAYPHLPGRLYDCPGCEARCHCTPGDAECVYTGQHNGLAAS